MLDPAVKDLISLGFSVWENTYRVTDDDEEALRLIGNLADSVKFDEDDLGSINISTPSLWLLSARWVQQGLPRIILDDQLAASLMATDVGLDSIDQIQPPWKSFMVEIPPGLLVDQNSISHQVILVQRVAFSSGTQWMYFSKTLGDETPGLFAKAPSNKMLRSWDQVESEVGDQESRIIYLVGRLILSLCLALSDPSTTSLREQKRSKGRGNKFRTSHSTPDPRNFIVGRPITVDCRSAIRDYVVGRSRKSSSINVQTLVRGHWKHQAHGVGHALRKLIHIEPYWKGPEDAKILVRATRVQG